MQENGSSVLPSRSDTNWPVQSQKKATSKQVEKELYWCSENKGAAQ